MINSGTEARLLTGGWWRATWPLVARCALAIVFCCAGGGKIADTDGFARSIDQYQLVPGVMVDPLAIVLPWIEVIAGLCIPLVAGLREGAYLITIGLLIVFTGALAAALFRGLDIRCGCFTQSMEATKVSGLMIARNLALLAVAIYCMWRDHLPKASVVDKVCGQSDSGPEAHSLPRIGSGLNP